jgi:SAM-dependent methyltransferase
VLLIRGAESTADRLFPERGAGGFSHRDGTVEFYSRVNALTTQSDIVLDFGAGRGAGLIEDASEYRNRLRCLKGKVKRVIGVDIDPAIKSNPGLDKSIIIQLGKCLPFDDASFDLIVSDFVFEHIDEPTLISQELDRILKPSGWLCARTPNRWQYQAVAARIIPERFHSSILSGAQPYRSVVDIFPKVHKMNDMSSLNKYFPADRFMNCSYYYTPEPSYFSNYYLFCRILMMAETILPRPLFGNLFVFLRKRK